MAEETIMISYGTQVLDFEVVRRGIFQNRRQLSQGGYDFHWSGDDLDLDKLPTKDQLQRRGYVLIGDYIQASFNKLYSNLAFLVSISMTEKLARVFGEQEIPKSQFPQVRCELDSLEKLTNIHFELLEQS